MKFILFVVQNSYVELTYNAVHTAPLSYVIKLRTHLPSILALLKNVITNSIGSAYLNFGLASMVENHYLCKKGDNRYMSVEILS